MTPTQVRGPRIGPALFVYIPFCRTVCTYCDFNVYSHLGKLFDDYTQALVTEMRSAAEALPAPHTIVSVAFGGGTPSILRSSLLVRVFDSLHSLFKLIPGGEVTFEANPGTVDLDKLKTLIDLGANRLSLGVQALDDARLRSFNRKHSSAESRAAFDLARKAGFENINLDLLFGLPDQTLSDWQGTLERVLEWEPEHLSLYGLQIEEGTALARQIARRRVTEPDADMAADMYMLAEERLGAAGFEHYEISNYARPNRESRHNLTYWLNESYIGVGASAHSYRAGERYSNLLNPTEYVTRLSAGESVVATRETISREREIGDTLMLGLRLARGIVFAEYKARFGEDVRTRFGETIFKLTQWGLMEVDEERMRLTSRGRLVSNQILWRFLP